MIALAAVVAGGLAAVVRYLVSLAFRGRGTLPLAVLVVNVVGSAVGGAAAGLTEAHAMSTDARLVVLGGVAGGLTTFSTWSLETIQLLVAGKGRTAAWSVLLNLGLGLLVASAAYYAAVHYSTVA